MHSVNITTTLFRHAQFHKNVLFGNSCLRLLVCSQGNLIDYSNDFNMASPVVIASERDVAALFAIQTRRCPTCWSTFVPHCYRVYNIEGAQHKLRPKTMPSCYNSVKMHSRRSLHLHIHHHSLKTHVTLDLLVAIEVPQADLYRACSSL